MLRRVGVFLVLGSAALTAGMLDAQEPAPVREAIDARHRSECRLAAQVLTTGQPAPRHEWALWKISTCDQSGPPVLARLWSETTVESDSLGLLINLSRRIRDRRLYDRIVEIALDASIPEFKRAAALALLGIWADGRNLDHAQFFEPGFKSISESGIRWSATSHPPRQHPGAVPMPTDVRRDVLTLAEQVASGNAGYRLKAAAEELARRLAWSIENNRLPR